MQVDYSKFDTALRKLGQDVAERKLTVEDLVELHDKAVEIYGGEKGIRDRNLLESICITPHQNVFGEELYPTVFDKAAKYLIDFSRYQVFLDGNKRTGVLAMAQELVINDYDINISNEDIYALTMDIANNRITEVSDVAKIIKEHSFINADFLDEEEKTANVEEEDLEEEKE